MIVPKDLPVGISSEPLNLQPVRWTGYTI